MEPQIETLTVAIKTVEQNSSRREDPLQLQLSTDHYSVKFQSYPNIWGGNKQRIFSRCSMANCYNPFVDVTEKAIRKKKKTCSLEECPEVDTTGGSNAMAESNRSRSVNGNQLRSDLQHSVYMYILDEEEQQGVCLYYPQYLLSPAFDSMWGLALIAVTVKVVIVVDWKLAETSLSRQQQHQKRKLLSWNRHAEVWRIYLKNRLSTEEGWWWQRSRSAIVAPWFLEAPRM